MNDLEVTDRMRAAVADVVAPPDLLPRVLERRRGRAYRRYGAAALAAVATAGVVVVAGAAPWAGEEPRPLGPAVPRPPLTSVSTSRFDLTYVPPGFVADRAMFQRRSDLAETEHLYVRAADGVTQFRLTTTLTDEPVTRATVPAYGGTVTEVRAGARTVFRLHDPDVRPVGTAYFWTEEPGLNVSVGAIQVGEEEALRFVAGLRLRPAAATTLRTPYDGEVVDPVTVPWLSGDLIRLDELEVTYVATDAPCRVLAEARVVETAAQVVVTLVEATPEDQRGEPCVAGGVTQRVRVRLSGPGTGRKILDGSATPPGERQVPYTYDLEGQ